MSYKKTDEKFKSHVQLSIQMVSGTQVIRVNMLFVGIY